jgi:hypothetical protein
VDAVGDSGTCDAPNVTAKEAAMRILMASVSLICVLFFSGCVTLQKSPAFGTLAGAGRYVEYDRQGARNLYPPSSSEPLPVSQSRYSVIR